MGKCVSTIRETKRKYDVIEHVYGIETRELLRHSIREPKSISLQMVKSHIRN